MIKKTFLLLTIIGIGACGDVRDSGNPAYEKISKPEDYYKEPHRPQFHFSPEANWMNDPNGMVYFDGEYHLFYQYYPDSTVWGPMHWGHAVSQDLVRWEHLPIALYPDELGYIFSGSAIVDWNNSSGFGDRANPPLVAIFTYHLPEGEQDGRNNFQYQGLAYSLDKGRTWTKYTENPVVRNGGKRDFRDPKVIWHEETERWIMVLAVGDHVEFYRSKDLKTWQYLSEFGQNDGSHAGVWECPDLIRLPVEGEDEAKWVLIVSIGNGGNRGSATQYFVGDFDGQNFYNSHYPERVIWLDHGRDNYAGVTWSDIPPQDGRKIFIGWMSNWDYATVVPTERWRSAMTLPRFLSLFKTVNGHRLRSYPVQELTLLRKKAVELNRQLINVETDWTYLLEGMEDLLDMELIISNVRNSGSFEIELRNDLGENLKFGYDDRTEIVYVDRSEAGISDFHETFAQRHEAPRLSREGKLPVRVMVDKSSIEVFFDFGEVVLTDMFFANAPYNRMTFRAPYDAVLAEGMIYELKSIWR